MTLAATKILILDDEVNIRRSLQTSLENEDYEVTAFSNSFKAFEALSHEYYDLAILDIKLTDIDGIQLFRKMKKHNIEVPVIFISGNASLEEAAQTVKEGAYDFLEKPFSADKLLITVQNCLDYNQLKRRLSKIEENINDDTLISQDERMIKLKNELAKVAQTDSTVLISGESGTGKELIAQMIHNSSDRSQRDFVRVNCSAIPEGLIESEMFGHVKGAFTGALQAKKGYFELAHGGTLFLDEIGDMSLATQAKVLRAIQNSEIQKVGSEKTIRIDVRIIAATHKDLKREVQQGTFREDLYYRINVVPLVAPPLREHPADIPLLIQHFITKFCKKHGMKNKNIEPECLRILKEYHWPGNVRELINLVERLVIMSGDKITVADIPTEFTSPSMKIMDSVSAIPLKEYREKIEREYIIQTLKFVRGNISRAAQVLQIDRTYLHKKISQYDIQKSNYFE